MLMILSLCVSKTENYTDAEFFIPLALQESKKGRDFYICVFNTCFAFKDTLLFSLFAEKSWLHF